MCLLLLSSTECHWCEIVVTLNLIASRCTTSATRAFSIKSKGSLSILLLSVDLLGHHLVASIKVYVVCICIRILSATYFNMIRLVVKLWLLRWLLILILHANCILYLSTRCRHSQCGIFLFHLHLEILILCLRTKFIIDVRLLRFLLVVNWTCILISTSEAFTPSVSASSISSASFLIPMSVVRFQLGALVCIELRQRLLLLRVLVVGSKLLVIITSLTSD